MALNFSDKKKETFILLAIVVIILSLIAWFYFDTLRLTPKTEEPQTTVQKKKKPTPPPANVVHKKIGAPKTAQESLPESATALQSENQPTQSDNDTVASAPEKPNETITVSKTSEIDTEDKQKEKTVAETTTVKPQDEPSSDTSEPTTVSDDETTNPSTTDTQTDQPSESGDADEADAALPEENSEVAQAPNKSFEKTEEEKPSAENEVSMAPDASEQTASPYRMRQPLHPYSIKLASNRVKSSALNGMKVFKNDQTMPYLVKMDLGAERGIWWNVYTGHYKTKQDALNALKTLNRTDARIKKLPYANLIGEYSSEEEMAAVYQRLEKQDYEPYVISDGAKWRLFVGDFLDIPGAARRNQAHLEDAGFTSQIVKR